MAESLLCRASRCYAGRRPLLGRLGRSQGFFYCIYIREARSAFDMTTFFTRDTKGPVPWRSSGFFLSPLNGSAEPVVGIDLDNRRGRTRPGAPREASEVAIVLYRTWQLSGSRKKRHKGSG